MNVSVALRSFVAFSLAVLLVPLPAPAAAALQTVPVMGTIHLDPTLPAGSKLNCGAIQLIVNNQTLSRSLSTPQGTTTEDLSGSNAGGCRFALAVPVGMIQFQPQSMSVPGHGTLEAYVPQGQAVRVQAQLPTPPVLLTALLFPRTMLALVSSGQTVQGSIMPGAAIQPGLAQYGSGSGGGWLGIFGPLVVKVTDELGRPAAGVPVTFSCPSATAQPLWTLCSFSTSTVTSGTDGLASVDNVGRNPALTIDIPASGNLSNNGTAGPFTYAITASAPNTPPVIMHMTFSTKF
jgi:hypothetical protein